MKDNICCDCAEKMGYEPTIKVFSVWTGKCEFCSQSKILTSLQNDWVKKEKREVHE